MDDNALEMLEFPRIREILADFTSFSVSRDLSINLQPSTHFDQVSLLLKQSAEARRLLSLRPDFSIGGACDIREPVMMAAKGKMLDPGVLIDIQGTLVAIRSVRNNLWKLSEELPLLWDMADKMIEQPQLENEIRRCITETGEVSDSASTRLAKLRRQLKESRQRLLDRLGAMVKSTSRQQYIQEPFITEREGRYVIPVKAEFRKEVRGIVHDISNTGATAFVEPWETVELGNDLRQLIVEERQEVERILATISTEIGINEVDICGSLVLLAGIDLALAKARYAEKVNATEPVITVHTGSDGCAIETGVLRLVNARHPLLKGKAVPLSVDIGRDFSILIITGPNTGGKTVALKTIGLLTLMAQAGLPIPASEESRIPIFDSVFADIGDQQSIEQTLSTFSWHIGNVVHIIRDSTRGSLVLLDELGISTDPNEGAALARSILLHFLARGTMVVATTHYNDLKVFAHTTSGLRNASLDFNPVTLAPTYHLTVGIPGRSNAFSIASRLGLSHEIIDAAKQMMAQDSREIESLLSDLMNEKQKYEAMHHDLEQEKHRVENLGNHLDSEIRRFREQEQNMLRETRDELLRDTARLQKLIRQAESELSKAKKRERIEHARKVLTSVHEQLEGEVWQAKADRIAEVNEVAKAGSIASGDRVRLVDRSLEGTVLSLTDNGRQIEVQVGNTRLRVGRGDVEKIEPSADEVPPAFHIVEKSPARMARSLELDLRGKRADEVPSMLDRYLNDAFLAQFAQVRIIHGYATGTVRQIVREILASHPLVKSFQPGEKGEGGDGVTVVYL